MGWTRGKLGIGLVIVLLTAITALAIPPVRRVFHPIIVRVRGARTVQDRITEFSDAKNRLQIQFAEAGVPYPPGQVILLGLKEERRLEVYAGHTAESLRRVAGYPILGASGGPGPKLREGDRQVPEGVYRVESLNPNSRFHVSLRLDYPNSFDREMARRDGRTNLGGDIMIHGGSASVGCLAMGNPVAEELFLLAHDTGIHNVAVILTPSDLRMHPPPDQDLEWRGDLYDEIRAAMVALEASAASRSLSR